MNVRIVITIVLMIASALNVIKNATRIGSGVHGVVIVVAKINLMSAL